MNALTASSSTACMEMIDVLRHLTPTLPSFDILGRLLRDPTLVLAPDEESSLGTTDSPNFNGPSGQGFMTHGYGLEKGSNGSAAGVGMISRRKIAIADLVRTEVLGAFVHNAIEWVQDAERQAQEGLISDDRAVKGVQNVSVSPFFSGLYPFILA